MRGSIEKSDLYRIYIEPFLFVQFFFQQFQIHTLILKEYQLFSPPNPFLIDLKKIPKGSISNFSPPSFRRISNFCIEPVNIPFLRDKISNSLSPSPPPLAKKLENPLEHENTKINRRGRHTRIYEYILRRGGGQGCSTYVAHFRPGTSFAISGRCIIGGR